METRLISHLVILSLLATPTCDARRGAAENQLARWKKANKQVTAIGINYQPVPSLTSTLRIGPNGPLAMEDFNFQAHLANAANDNIPERVVHAKAAGAKGYFVVTHSMSNHTKAAVFSKVGLRTPVVVRLSTVAGNIGSADTVVDQRGFAVKFKTTEGMYDLTMINLPAFPIRDTILFSQLSRSRARNPQTHLPDPNMFFDFTINRPEATFNVFLFHSNLGFFKTYRYMEGHAINAFRWTGGTLRNSNPLFVRYHMMPDANPITSSMATYTRRAGKDPDYMLRDLYNSIARKKYYTYTLFVQMFTMDDAKQAKFNMFDTTKILFVSDFPLIPIGKMVLNENPTDYFNDVEQAAFNPGNLVPGVEISPDRLIQGRSFGYLHTQIHRLGFNFYQLPINRPTGKVKDRTYLRNGPMNIDGNGNGGPVYYPNSFDGPEVDPKAKRASRYVDSGRIGAFDAVDESKDGDNYFQIDRYWREVLSPKQRRDAIRAIAKHLSGASREVQERSLKVNWDPINEEVGKMMREELANLSAGSSNMLGKKKTPTIPANRNTTKESLS